MTRVKRFSRGNSRSGSPSRPLFAACAALIMGLTMAAQAHAGPAFAQYDDVGGNNFTFTSTSTSASFTGTASGFLTFDSFGGQPGTAQAVTLTLNLTANATDKASSGFGLTSQPFTPTGTLTFTAQSGPNSGMALLIATFNGTLVGTTGGGLPSMNVVVPTNSLTVTSNVASIQAALTALPATGTQLDVNNLIQPGGGNGPSINGTTGYLNDFNANIHGQFDGPDPVPEPGSVVLFGIGLCTAGLVAIRRKASTTLPIG